MRDSQTALWLDGCLGFLGLFGIGEIYLGRLLRGAGLLALTAAK